ncbi:MAG: hypothetical protein AAF624_18090 [Bacteroidota bacterium]
MAYLGTLDWARETGGKLPVSFAATLVGLLGLLHLTSGCVSAGEVPEDPPSVACDTLTVAPDAIRSAAGSIHAYPLKPEWLRHPMTIKDARMFLWSSWDRDWASRELRELQADTLLVRFVDEPFLKLVSAQRSRDRFWYYTTSQDYWSALAGQAGVVLIRDCTVVGSVITMQS